MTKWKVDLVASQAHYQKHMLPIWNLLPDKLKGSIHPLHTKVRMDPGGDRIGLVAAWQDVDPLRGIAPMIYVEHGAGQGYAGDEKSAWHPAYSTSGGARHLGVIGFICPSETVARRWTSAPAVAVGCPKIDPYRDAEPLIPHSVCFGFHWPASVAPEARSAYDYYAASLPDIVEHFKSQGWTVYGHAHPKWEGLLDGALANAGMEILQHEESVFGLASALIMDNSSLMYEFASLDRPVVALNAPWYRRDVEHGLRFWSHVPGRQIDTPEELYELNLWSLLDEDETLRHRAANHAYAFDDGSSAQRAADFIVRRIEAM